MYVNVEAYNNWKTLCDSRSTEFYSVGLGVILPISVSNFRCASTYTANSHQICNQSEDLSHQFLAPIIQRAEKPNWI